MRVTSFISILLAALLLASTLGAVANAAASLPQGMFAYPAYDAKDIKDMIKINDLIGQTASLAKDTYKSDASDLPSAETIHNMISGDQISSLPDPMALIMAMAPPASADNPYGFSMDRIKKALIGPNLTYSNFAGKPMNYTITADSIKSIRPTTFNTKAAWKVRVGEGMSWDLIVDGNGKILDMKQLFYT